MQLIRVFSRHTPRLFIGLEECLYLFVALDLIFMFLAVIAFTISSFRHYIMFNHQHLVEDDNDDDDESSRNPCPPRNSHSLLHERVHSGSATVWDKMRSIVTYACTYLWAISLILLIVIIYASIRGPLNILNSFNTGKVKPRSPSFSLVDDPKARNGLLSISSSVRAFVLAHMRRNR